MVENLSWRILLVEDDEDDYILTRSLLREIKARTITVTWVRTFDEALEALERDHPDAALVDYSLGARNGLELAREVTQRGLTTPLILLTGHGSYELDLEASQAGFTDYLTKSEIRPITLERALRYTIERQRLLLQNQQQRDLLQAIFDLDPGGVAVLSGRDLIYRYANPGYQAITPYPDKNPVGHTLTDIWPSGAGTQSKEIIHRVLETGEPVDISRYPRPFPDGSLHFYNYHLRRLVWEGEQAILAVLWETTALEEARRAAEQAAAESRRRADELNTVIRAMDDAVIIFDDQGVPAQANPAAAAYFGFDPVAAGREGMSGLQIFRSADGQPVPPENYPAQRILRGERPGEEQYFFFDQQGAERTMLVSAAPLTSDDQLWGVVVVWHDITSLARAQQALSARENKLAQAATLAQLGYWTWEAEPNHVTWSVELAELFGIPPDISPSEELFMQAIHPDDRERVSEATRAALEEDQSFDIEVRFHRPDGETRLGHAVMRVNRDETGRPVSAYGALQDITNRRRVEEEARQNALQIEVHHYLMEGREKERIEIARDLHDGPLQEIIAANFALQEIWELAGETTWQPKVDAIQSSLQRLIGDLRAFCNELRPPALAPFGLEKAIRSHAETVREKHPELELTLDLEGDGKSLQEAVRLALFRIYQELVNNVIRHAKASQVQVCFKLSTELVELRVEDNGSGFEAPQDWLELARQGHLGLVGVRERAEAIGGRLQLVSRPGGGTRAQVVIPLTTASGVAKAKFE